MQLNIYERKRDRIGVVDQIESLIWTRRYNAPGGFRMILPLTAAHLDLLRLDRLICRDGDDEPAEIRSISISKDERGAEQMEVTGRFLTGWLERRVIDVPLILTDHPLQNALTALIDRYFKQPVGGIPERAVPAAEMFELLVAPTVAVSASLELGETLLDVVQRIIKRSGLGMRMALKVGSGLTLEIFEGRQLTTDAARVIFSEEFDNVIGQEYETGNENHSTAALVRAENAVGQELLIWENEEGAGLDRREVFIDAADIPNTDESGGSLTPDQIKSAMRVKAAQSLAQRKVYKSLESSVRAGVNLRYKEDYNLGDVVLVENKRWGIRAQARIVEITETYEQSRQGLGITFGYRAPSWIESIKQMRR